MKEQNMPKADFVTSLVLVAFGITILILSIKMPRLEELGINPYSAPGIVPGFLGGIIASLGLILLIRSILQNGHHLGITRQKVVDFFKDKASIRVWLTIALCCIYGIGLLGRMPYVLATFLYVFVFVTTFEFRRDIPLRQQKKMVLFAFIQAVLVAGIVAAIFRYLFLVDLP